MENLEVYKILGKIIDLPSIELPSEIFYHNLKTSYKKLYQHYEECTSLDYPHNKDLKVKKICAKIIKYLKNNYKEQNDSKLKDHHCNLLSHWIYEQLAINFNINTNIPFRIYGGFQLILIDLLNGPNESQAINCLRKENKDFYEKCERCNPKSVLLGLDCDKLLLAPKKAEAGQHGPGSLAPTPSSRQNSGSTDTYGNVLLEVVATSMTSGMIFKFTPLERRFRNGFGWNNYAPSNVNGEGNMLFAETHDPFSPHSEEREHHIGYLPA
ncbi:Plasmodium vivax Vir protein, putative [Plasmodium vivax]|nr:Plasmodium vivax Vir protein, putative [Plasmodium vivax]